MLDPVNDWAWLAVLGAILEIVGLLIAVTGVSQLKGEVFPGRPVAHVRMGRWIWARFSRWVLRKKPDPVTGNRQATLMGAGMVASGFAQIGFAKPDTFEPSEQWIKYLDQQLVP